VTLASWLLFVLTCIIAAATPGPGNLLVITTSLNNGTRRAFLVIMGILCGLLSLSAVAVAGFSAVLESSAGLFRWVQIAGAVYILYLGIRLLRAPSEFKPIGQGQPGRRPLGFMLEGVGVSVANPKSIGFFVALLPPFVDPLGNLGVQYTILISTQMVVTFMVLSAYSLSTRKLSPWLRSHGGGFNKVTGGIFVVLSLIFVQGNRS